MTRETAWEAPTGVNVRYLSESEREGGGGGSSSGSKDGSSPMLVTMALILPIALPMLGLLICYFMASREGLADVLKSLKKPDRDRARKRRGQSAGGNFRHRQKLSQDGKGGRSANS